MLTPLLVNFVFFGGILCSSLTHLLQPCTSASAHGGSLWCSYTSPLPRSSWPSFQFNSPSSTTQLLDRSNTPPSKIPAFSTSDLIMSRHSGPSTRSQAVSDSYPPTHILVCWVQSLVAALAGGSPLSSPSPSS